MKRWPFALAVLALSSVLVAAAEQASGQAFEKRLSAFYAQARADRQRAGLDVPTAKQRFPTPELKLASAAAQVGSCARPGETVDLRYTGKLPAGSLVGFTCPELEVLDLTAAEGKVSAKVRVGKVALPHECRLTAVSATSAIRRDFPAIRIAGKYAWDLQLGNGWTTRWTWQSPGCGVPGEATSVWMDKGKVLGTVPLRLDGSGTRWTGTVAQSPEEQEEILKAAQSPEAQKDVAEIQQLSQAMGEECGKLEPAKMGPCFQRYQEKMKPVQARMKEQDKARRERMETRKVGCSRLRLEVAPDGKVTGRAQGCGAPGETAVSGKVSAVAG